MKMPVLLVTVILQAAWHPALLVSAILPAAIMPMLLAIIILPAVPRAMFSEREILFPAAAVTQSALLMKLPLKTALLSAITIRSAPVQKIRRRWEIISVSA